MISGRTAAPRRNIGQPQTAMYTVVVTSANNHYYRCPNIHHVSENDSHLIFYNLKILVHSFVKLVVSEYICTHA